MQISNPSFYLESPTKPPFNSLEAFEGWGAYWDFDNSLLSKRNQDSDNELVLAIGDSSSLNWISGVNGTGLSLRPSPFLTTSQILSLIRGPIQPEGWTVAGWFKIMTHASSGMFPAWFGCPFWPPASNSDGFQIRLSVIETTLVPRIEWLSWIAWQLNPPLETLLFDPVTLDGWTFFASQWNRSTGEVWLQIENDRRTFATTWTGGVAVDSLTGSADSETFFYQAQSGLAAAGVDCVGLDEVGVWPRLLDDDEIAFLQTGPVWPNVPHLPR